MDKIPSCSTLAMPKIHLICIITINEIITITSRTLIRINLVKNISIVGPSLKHPSINDQQDKMEYLKNKVLLMEANLRKKRIEHRKHQKALEDKVRAEILATDAARAILRLLHTRLTHMLSNISKGLY